MCCRVQPHQASPRDTAELMKLQRKWPLSVGVSLVFVNVFLSATGQFCISQIQGSVQGVETCCCFVYIRLMQEQLCQVAQVDSGHLHAL